MECQGITKETDLISWSLETPARPKDYATITFGITGLPANLYSAIRRVSDGTIVAKTSGSGTITSSLPGDLYQFGYTNGIIFWPLGSATTLSDGSAYNAQYDLTHGFGISQSLMDPELVYYSAGYDEQTVAMSGKTTYIKSMALSTANQVAGGNNVKSTKSIQFVGDGSGRITSSENLLVDGSSTWSKTGDSILCPFGSQNSEFIPAFCNIVQAGSTMDMNLVSMTTTAESRFVSADSAVPVACSYDISAGGINTANVYSPANGSVSAFIRVHAQEARGNVTKKSEDLSYAETSSASGLIEKFTKNMNYESGNRLI